MPLKKLLKQVETKHACSLLLCFQVKYQHQTNLKQWGSQKYDIIFSSKLPKLNMLTAMQGSRGFPRKYKDSPNTYQSHLLAREEANGFFSPALFCLDAEVFCLIFVP